MLPPEVAHDSAISLLEWTQNSYLESFLEERTRVDDDRLQQTLWGQSFPNPVGLAAGFDKNGRVPRAIQGLGFGHLEVGGVTAEAQEGNPKPRLFRLAEDEALINRMGFNNDGARRVAERLATMNLPEIPMGINMGKSKSTPLERAEEDYEFTYEQLKEYGDYFVINVSSPNTPGLRSLQDDAPLSRILRRLKKLGAEPLLVKISPDLEPKTLENIVELCEEFELDGIIATNTTTERSDSLESSKRDEEGGLSGRPLEERSTELVSFIAKRTDLPLVGVGGISKAEDAYRKIRNGACLVQLYTAFIYRGPTVARDINEGLLNKLDDDGHESLQDAVGTNL
jgi:dihydroorotate dehydrogenase